MSEHRHEADYIDRIMATVRQHAPIQAWPYWAIALSDEIEDLRADVAAAEREITTLREALTEIVSAAPNETYQVRRLRRLIEIAAAALAGSGGRGEDTPV